MARRKTLTDEATIAGYFSEAEQVLCNQMLNIIHGIMARRFRDEVKALRKTRSDAGTPRKKGDANVSAAAN